MSLSILKDDTFAFNRFAGNDLKVSRESFVDQFLVLQEEVREVADGIGANNIEEVVDGVIDTIVVALGLWQKLETMGVDMNRAASLIGYNNLTKFPRLESHNSLPTVKMYKEKGIEVKVEFDPSGNHYVFKNAQTNKILKPYGFESVDIKECIPKDLLEKGFV